MKKKKRLMNKKVIQEIIKPLTIEKNKHVKIQPVAEIPKIINQLTPAFTRAEQWLLFSCFSLQKSIETV